MLLKWYEACYVVEALQSEKAPQKCKLNIFLSYLNLVQMG